MLSANMNCELRNVFVMAGRARARKQAWPGFGVGYHSRQRAWRIRAGSASGGVGRFSRKGELCAGALALLRQRERGAGRSSTENGSVVGWASLCMPFLA